MNKRKYSGLKKLPLTMLVVTGVLTTVMTSPLHIQYAHAQEEDPGEMARESIELMMKSLRLVIDAIPQYEMPVINDNGDIIIRRKQKDDWEDLDDTPETDPLENNPNADDGSPKEI
ncbi:hypothetical protein [Kiloniella antarctica]|uniref:Uncharacterized protein n=1 Tax=Kiloniella antarctica TaxID=1550907 RepID=A0ABW5BJ23_9PROT